MLTLVILTGLYTALSGPAFDDWRARLRDRKDFPAAKVVFFLPSAVESRPE